MQWVWVGWLVDFNYAVFVRPHIYIHVHVGRGWSSYIMPTEPHYVLSAIVIGGDDRLYTGLC